MTVANESTVPLPERAIRAFVWDLADEGLEDVMGRLADCRFDGLHLALAYHGGRFYCPHNPRRVLVHAPDGALYFQPLMSCYEQIQPRVHPEYGSGAFVARARDRAHDHGLNFTAWVSLLNNMTLSMENPDCACRNALGDALEGTLCPSHPEVRAYAEALVEDLAHRVRVDAIELEDFAFPSHDAYIGPMWRSVTIGPNLGYLLSLCFCEQCRRRAEETNIEVDDLAYRVERMIRQALVGDISDRRIADEIADPYHPVSRYAKVRFETITSFVDDLLDEIAGSGAALQLALSEEPDACWRWGIEPHILRQRGLRATIQADRSATEAAAFVGRYAELLQIGRDLAVDVRLTSAGENARRSPAATIEACQGIGVDRFVFSYYGLATFEMLDWACAMSKR
jgi:hypothetical protein